MNSLILNTKQSAMVISGDMTMHCIAVGPQPIIDVDGFIYDGWYRRKYDYKDMDRGGRFINDWAPYKPDQKIYVREPWVYRQKHGKYYYKADFPDFEPYAHNGWKSPSTMPRSAIRTWLTVTDCVIMRVRELSVDTVHKCGEPLIPRHFHDIVKKYVTHRFGKYSWVLNTLCYRYSFKLSNSR